MGPRLAEVYVKDRGLSWPAQDDKNHQMDGD